MNNLKYIITILILAISPIKLHSQDNICTCCSYSSLQYPEDYNDIFNPSLIKSKGITEVVVFTKAKSLSDSIERSKYREIKFNFNKNGLVILKTHYNRMGKPHSTYELKRDRLGRIYQQVFFYIDSLERKHLSYKPDIIDFKYDTRNRLMKIKERDFEGKVLPDNEAKYTLLKYDNKNRIIKTETHRNYTDESSVSITTYTFLEDSLSSTYESFSDGELSVSGEKKYNENWKVTNDKTYNEALKSMAFEEHFEYDKTDRLIKYQSIAGLGSFDECPENGSYTDNYEYHDEGFLIGIIHTYGNNTCEMTFEYRK